MAGIPAWVGPAIGAAGSLVGGMLGGSNASKQQEKSLAFQREMARNQIKWRVADARQAGINPLAALGASLYQGSFTQTGNDFGDGLAAAAGQLGDAVSRRESDKRAAEMHRLALEKVKAETAEAAARANLANSQAADIVKQQGAASTVARAAQESNYRQDDPAVISTTLGDVRLGHHSPQQVVEDQYGGFVGEIAGATRFGYDVLSQFLDDWDPAGHARRARAGARGRQRYRGFRGGFTREASSSRSGGHRRRNRR